MRGSSNDQILCDNDKVIPLFGRDEMNFAEFPLGPITQQDRKTFEIDHVVVDRATKRKISRRLIVTGSDAFGLPRPTDDLVLVGMKALTQEAGFQSRKVFFSQYRLCQTIGWNPDGRSYRKLEHAMDRIAGTTFKFKNAWWDKGEESWRSHTFHMIDNVELCSRDRYDKAMTTTGRKQQALCYFVWNEVIWKSFQDGFIKSIDMEMFRKIARGRRREVPLRLFRWLDKRFYREEVVRISVSKLSEGTLGLAEKYPSQQVRVISRAARVLVDCGYLGSFDFKKGGTHTGIDAIFHKRKPRPTIRGSKDQTRQRSRGADGPSHESTTDAAHSEHELWLSVQTEVELFKAECEALDAEYGTPFERDWVRNARRDETEILGAGSGVRQHYVRRFMETRSVEAKKQAS